jgi:transcriptional regulator with XRE-family HTH domain
MSSQENDSRILLIASKIKQLRKEKGFTSYEDFAVENNLDRKQYWRVENGGNITLKTLLKILDLHKMTINEFFAE